jgi:hypothetical protein
MSLHEMTYAFAAIRAMQTRSKAEQCSICVTYRPHIMNQMMEGGIDLVDLIEYNGLNDATQRPVMNQSFIIDRFLVVIATQMT